MARQYGLHKKSGTNVRTTKEKRDMAKIFIVRIEDDDFDAVREKYMTESRQGTDDEQVMKDFMKTKKGVHDVQVWQVK